MKIVFIPFKTIVVGILFLCIHTPTFTAEPTLQASVPYLELPMPDGGIFKMSYNTHLINFGCDLGTFLTVKSRPAERPNLTLQCYGSYDDPRIYVGAKQPQEESYNQPIAYYHCKHFGKHITPQLEKHFFPSHAPAPLLTASAQPYYYAPVDSQDYYPQPAYYPLYQPATPVHPALNHAIAQYPIPQYDYATYEQSKQTSSHQDEGCYYPLPSAYATQVSYPPTVTEPMVPVLIAKLTMQEIMTSPLTPEQITLVDHCGTVPQKLALIERLKKERSALAAQSQTQQPATPTPTIATTFQAVAAPHHPVENPSFPALVKIIQKAQTQQPPLSVAQPKPSAATTAPAAAAIQPVKPQVTLTHPSPWLTDCGKNDITRYRTIKDELQKQPCDYALCINLLKSCDTRTTSYVAHVVFCAKALTALNRFPEHIDLHEFDEIISRIQSISQQIPLTRYLSKRDLWHKAQKAKEAQAQREAEAKAKEAIDQKKREAAEQEKKDKELRDKEENRRRMKEASKQRAVEIAARQEAAVAKSKSQQVVIPDGTIVVQRHEKAYNPAKDDAEIAKVLKAGAMQAENKHYDAITSLITAKNYTEVFIKMSECKKNSRRFANLLLTILLEIQELSADDTIHQHYTSLALELLATELIEKPLTNEEKITVYKYVYTHTDDKDELQKYIEKLKALKEPLTMASLQAATEKLKEKPLEISSESKECVVVIEQYKDQGLAIAYNKDEAHSVNVMATVSNAVVNLKIVDETTFDAHLIACIGYIEKILEATDSSEEAKIPIEVLVYHFIKSLNGKEHLFTNAIAKLFEESPNISIFFYDEALFIFSPQQKYILAQKGAIILPELIKMFEDLGFSEEERYFYENLLALQKETQEVIALGKEQTASLQERLRTRIRAKRTDRPTERPTVSYGTKSTKMKTDIPARESARISLESKSIIKDCNLFIEDMKKSQEDILQSIKTASDKESLEEILKKMETDTAHFKQTRAELNSKTSLV